MKTSKQFYKELGVERLSKRKLPIHTRNELDDLLKIIGNNKNQKILDLACGYGRLTIPLAKLGYNLEGIDISPNLLEKAKKETKKANLEIKFRLGDMRNLPYNDNKFDVIICMWSAFIELHDEKEQEKAVKEMHRVLKPKGFSVIDMPIFSRKKKEIDMSTDDERIREGKIVHGIIAGIEAPESYAHNKKTLKKLMRKTGIKKYKIKKQDFGGRKRLILRFWEI